MKKVTISLDDELAHRIRTAAAKAGKSMSRYLAEAGLSRVEADERRSRQSEALEKIFAGPKWDVMENGRMPTVKSAMPGARRGSKSATSTIRESNLAGVLRRQRSRKSRAGRTAKS
jgi:predicted transcriptional regulator